MIYTSILYGMCVYYNIRILNNWTIQTEIGKYVFVCTQDIKYFIKLYCINSFLLLFNSLFLAFTQKQFNNALLYIIPISICIGIASLGYIIINTMKDLVIITKGTQSKAIVNLVTILYTAVVCLIFTLSIVSKYKNT